MFENRSRGQATIGVALIIALTILGTVAVIGLGSTALSDIQGSSETGSAELALTQFDSRASQVALGDSESQTIDAGQNGGSYRVDPDAGHVRIVHKNFDGQDDGNDEVLYESDIGTMYYERGDTTFAYQAGGVWRRSDRGGSTMVSPPEFHYRGSTLTFPIVRVNQNTSGVPAVQSGAGSPRLRVSKAGDSRDIYANRSDGYPDGDGDGDGWPNTPTGGDGDGGAYDNPATNGTVVVFVTSEYYDAWAEYFRTRTDGTVDTSDTPGGRLDSSDDPDGDGPKGKVAVELTSTGFSGDFGMPGDGSSITVRGIEDHSMTDYEITLVPDGGDSANFNNLQWSMYVQDGQDRFEMRLTRGSASSPKCNDESTDLKADLTVYYSDNGGDDYQGWHADDAYSAECRDLDGDGSKDEIVLVADFVDDEDGDDGAADVESGDPQLEYVDKDGMNKLTYYSVQGGDTAPSTYTMDGHGVSWEPKSYDLDSGDTETADRVVNHYFSELGPGFDLTIDDKGSDTVQESGSSGTIRYGPSDEFITYMHITENDVTIRID